MTAIRFTLADLEAASDAWGCNCAPAAIAAICGLTLDEVRQYLGSNWPGYTNLTAMRRALESTGRRFAVERTDVPFIDPGSEWPQWGFARIQWEGPWTQPGANPRWAYRYTHWVGAAKRTSDASIGVFDVNSVAHTPDNSGWTSLEAWRDIIVPWIVAGIPRATGGWHVTHAIEVQR